MGVSARRLRDDLVVSRRETAGGTTCVVKDPVRSRFFRMGEVEFFIAQQLDETTPLEVVRLRAERRFDAQLTAESVDAFVRSLDEGGLLQSRSSRTRSERSKRIRGSLLYLRLPILDPDRVVTWIARWAKPVFTSQFVVLSILLVLVALVMSATNGAWIAAESAALVRASTIPLIVAVMLVTISAHELAHGTTCKHFGGEVREMGFMLLYFQPAMYCNVSDAWLFPEKRKRLLVSAAGMYLELVLWALATVAWRITEADTVVHRLGLVVMIVSGLKTLLNLNPFIKLDGYYLLSDWLDIPNLRRKSFRYVGSLLQKLSGLGTTHAVEADPRERRIYLAYGAVAVTVSFALLAWVYLTAGRALVELREPTALAVLTALVGARSSQRLRRMFGRATRQDDEDDGDSSSATTNGGTPPTSDKGAPRKIGRSVSRQLLWAALAAAVLALLFVGRMQLRIRGGVSVLPHVSTEVRSEVEGIVAEVLVSEGDRVQRGAVLARLSGRALVSELAQTDAAIREADAELAKQVTGPTGEEIAVAEAAVARGRDRLSYAEAKVERINELFAAKSAPRQELEDAQADAAAAANDLREARARLDVLRRGTRPEDIAATRARVEKLGAQRTFALDQRSRLDIVAPVSGVIATPARQLMLLPGQLISRGAMIATIYDYQTVSAHLVIAERDIGDVRVGQPVVLRTRAYPDVEFRGRVTSIATAVYGGIASPSSAGTGAVATGAPPEARSFVVTTDIENPELLLKPGMSGEAKILAGERRIADLVTRRLYRILRVEVWSWW